MWEFWEILMCFRLYHVCVKVFVLQNKLLRTLSHTQDNRDEFVVSIIIQKSNCRVFKLPSLEIKKK